MNSTFITRCLLCLTFLLWERTCLTATGGPDTASWFPQSSPRALVRCLQEPPTKTEVAPGRVVTRRYEPHASKAWVLIRSTLGSPVSTHTLDSELPVLDLVFRLNQLAADSPFRPLTYSNEEWYGSTFWTGPDWTRVGRDWHHPGQDTPSVRCFRAPRDGRVEVSGRAYKLHKIGDGVRLIIRHGAREVWKAEIEGQDDKGVEPKLSLEVSKGDPIRFIVHKRGEIFCDTTYWDPVVTYENNEAYRASASFGVTPGAGNWFYEMLQDDRSGAGIPVLRSVGRDMTLRETPLASDAVATLSHGDSLPLAILSNGDEDSGVWLALDPHCAWSVGCELSQEGSLSVHVKAAPAKRSSKRETTQPLPLIVLGAFEGPWTAALQPLKRAMDSIPTDFPLQHFTQTVQNALDRATRACRTRPEFDLLLMAQSEWRVEDGITETPEAYRLAARKNLDKSWAVLADLRSALPEAFVRARSAALGALLLETEAAKQDVGQSRSLYLRARLLKRDIVFSNPLLHFGRILFCKRVPTSYSHLVMQYYGWRARPGGGLFLLERPGLSLNCRDLLGNRLGRGNVLEPRLSYDARRIVFSHVACPETPYRPEDLPVNEEGPDEGYYHLYEVGTEGAGLRQLTSGRYDDLMPVYLPDGGLAFSSTRRKGYSRCFGLQFSRRWDSYALHRMEADGSNVRVLSRNDVNEWFPTVDNTGNLVYARWDYIDRDAVTHQNLWATRPDGTNPIAVWGNASPLPHCTFQAKAVPGSHKFVAIASAHHSITAGPLILIDPYAAHSDLKAVTRLTPGPFPEAEGWSLPGYYSAPWPLSEKCFLAAYCPTRLHTEGQEPNLPNNLGLYVVDTFGNRELLYRDPQIGSDNPTPLSPRQVSPHVASLLPPDRSEVGEFLVQDIYSGLGDLPRGRIKELRVIQIFPKTTPVANTPLIGIAGEENARAILGTVPVEVDGSVRFTAPAGKALLFQALDEKGFAYQTMRSLTYLQPGERVACVGCHEKHNTAPPNRRLLALTHPPSQLDPGELGGEPFSYMRVVQPVLDAHCVRCHSGEKAPHDIDLTRAGDRGFTRSYWSLCGPPTDFQGGDANPQRVATALVPRFGQRNQIQVTPAGGMYGALGSRLMKLLREGHYGVSLSDSETRRLAAWIDCNAIFYGVYDPERQADQLAGKTVPMPEVQ